MQRNFLKSLLRGGKVSQRANHFQLLAQTTSYNSPLFNTVRNFSSQNIKHPEDHYHPHEELQIKHKIIKDASLFKALLTEGRTHLSKKRYTEAEKALTKALEMSLKLFGEQNQVTGITLFALANLFKETGVKEKAKPLFVASFDVLSQDPAKNRETLERIEKALEILEKGDEEQPPQVEVKPKEAILKEIQLAKTEKRNEDLIKLYDNLARSYADEKNFDQALSYKELSLTIAEKIYENDQLKLFYAFFDSGIFYKEARKYRDAVALFFKGLHLVETKKGDEAERCKFMAYQNLGRVYVLLKEYGESLEYFLKAYKLKEKQVIKDQVELSGLHQEIGLVYFFLKRGREAIDQFEKSLEMKTELNDRIGVARLNQQIAESYLFLLKDLKASKEYFLKTLEIRQDIYGDSHAETDHIKKALKFIEANTPNNGQTKA